MKSEDAMSGQNDSSAPQKQERPGRAMRVRMIREAVKREKLSGRQQLAVAENMWRILEDAAQRGIPKSRVLHEGGAGKEGDSTKRLERYAVNPALDPAAKNVRKNKLTKGPARYLRLAEAAGKLVEQDSDFYVVTLFDGTDFAATGDVAAAEDVFGELTDLLRTICAGIAREHHLQRIAKLCDERYLCYYDRNLRQNRDDRWSDTWRRFVDGAGIHGLLDDNEKWAMPYASVLIGWSDIVEDLAFRITPRDAAMSGERSEATTDRLLKGSLKLEIRLAILPLGPGGAMEPAFITCPWTALSFGSLRNAHVVDRDGHITEEASFVYRSKFDGVRCDYVARGTPRVLEHFGWTGEPLFDTDAWEQALGTFAASGPSISYFDKYQSRLPVRVDLVSPASCRRLLGLRRASSAVTGHEATTVVDDLDPALDEMDDSSRELHWQALYESVIDDPENPRWRTRPDSLAETLEYSLFYVSKPERRFDHVLDRACSQLKNDVLAKLDSVDQVRNSAKAELYMKWDAGVKRDASQ